MFWNGLSVLPDQKQIAKINQTIGCHRLVANLYLSARKNAFDADKQQIATFKRETFPLLKAERDYLKAVDKFALETACEQVDNAYQKFFKGLEWLSQIQKHASKQTYTTKFTNNNIKIVNKDNTLFIQLPKLGLVPLFPRKPIWNAWLTCLTVPWILKP